MRATASGDAVCTKCNAEIAAERFELWKELKSKGWDLPLLEVQEWSQLTYNRILKNTPTANELSAMGVFNILMGAPFTWSLEHLQEITSWVNSKEKTPIPLLCLLYERFGKWARYKDFASWGEVGQTTVRAYLENPKSMLKPPPHIMQVSVNFALDMANKLRPEYVIGSPFIMSMPIQEIKGIREWVTSGKHFEEPAVLVKWHKKLNIFNTVSLATPRPSSITTPITVTSYPGGITGEQTSTTFSR